MASYGARLVAGDIEIVCGGGAEHPERWTTASPLQWKLHVLAGGTGFGPYFPGAPSNACGGLTQSTPGMQSAIQAILAWNNATIPGTTILGSSFTFDATGTPSTPTSPVSRTDLVNEIDLYPPANWFKANGFSGSLATTRVTIDPANPNSGDIVDADIVVNTTQVKLVTPTVAFWSFLENSASYGQWIASDTPNNSGAAPTPSLGFADLQGTITHELGHVAGLGHSVIDSSASATGSGFPTMFPFAQAVPLPTTSVNKYPGGCTSNFTGNVAGTIYSNSAQTLHYDDVVALSRQYPSAGFATLGRIQGTVKDSSGNPILGAAVVAVRDSPSASPTEVPRVQTLSYAGGAYSLDGLTDGDYFVYIEPVDQDPSGASSPEYYFGNIGDVPNYVDLTGGGGCITYVPFKTEFYNTSDQALEVQCAATAVTISSGGTVTGVNFVVSASTAANILSVGVVLGGVSPTYHSPRGIRFTIPAGGAGTRVVEFKVTAGTAFAGLAYRIQFAEVRTTNLVSTLFNPPQLDQIIQTSNAAYPSALSGMLDGSGNATFQLGFTSALQHCMVFAQVDVGPVGAEVYSNCTAIWVIQ